MISKCNFSSSFTSECKVWIKKACSHKIWYCRWLNRKCFLIKSKTWFLSYLVSEGKKTSSQCLFEYVSSCCLDLMNHNYFSFLDFVFEIAQVRAIYFMIPCRIMSITSVIQSHKYHFFSGKLSISFSCDMHTLKSSMRYQFRFLIFRQPISSAHFETGWKMRFTRLVTSFEFTDLSLKSHN